MHFATLGGRRAGQPTVMSPRFTGGRLLHTVLNPARTTAALITIYRSTAILFVHLHRSQRKIMVILLLCIPFWKIIVSTTNYSLYLTEIASVWGFTMSSWKSISSFQEDAEKWFIAFIRIIPRYTRQTVFLDSEGTIAPVYCSFYL